MSDLGSKEVGPARPSGPFVKTEFGSGKDRRLRSFLGGWYFNRPWLEFSLKSNAAFCFPCRLFQSGSKVDSAFVSVGFKNWKKSPAALDDHGKSDSHKQSMSRWAGYQSAQQNETVVQLLANVENSQIKENRKYLSVILDALVFLAKQGLPTR